MSSAMWVPGGTAILCPREFGSSIFSNLMVAREQRFSSRLNQVVPMIPPRRSDFWLRVASWKKTSHDEFWIGADQTMRMQILRITGMQIFILHLLVVCALGQTQPKTVTEFYLALPGGINGIEGTSDSEVPGFADDFFFYDNERNESRDSILKYRKSLIKIEDLKNGYLRLESNKWQGWVEIALFKKADGSYVVAISQVACGQGCSGGVIFATYKSGHWKNITRQVFPHPSQGYYRLPRIGTSIVLICGDKSDKQCHFGEELAEFQWNKEKFVAP